MINKFGLQHRRTLNIVFGILLTLVQLGSLMAGDISMHYFFFSIIEIITSLCIVWLAWKWTENEVYINYKRNTIKTGF
jgi:Family of unknown function (DUF6326)